jgi:protein-L-isoaspartate(D-aspartate) O-methyltransferase
VTIRPFVTAVRNQGAPWILLRMKCSRFMCSLYSLCHVPPIRTCCSEQRYTKVLRWTPQRNCNISADGGARPIYLSWLHLIACGALCLAACRAGGVDPATPSDTSAARAQLLAELRHENIRDEHVLNAIARVPREEFVRPQDRARAYADEALPIGSGQTISQPYMVAYMSQLLELRGDERVLDIGTGSGYQAAILAKLAREVYSIEIDPTLAASGRERLARLGYENVQVRIGDGWYGWKEAAPFDAIILTAAAPRIPEPLVAQLKAGGRLVMPIGDEGAQSLIRVRKQDGGLKIEHLTDVLFVPMIGAVRTPPR